MYDPSAIHGVSPSPKLIRVDLCPTCRLLNLLRQLLSFGSSTFCRLLCMWSARLYCFLFFFNDSATTETYTLSLHDALLFFLKDPPPPEISLFPLHGPLLI